MRRVLVGSLPSGEEDDDEARDKDFVGNDITFIFDSDDSDEDDHEHDEPFEGWTGPGSQD